MGQPIITFCHQNKDQLWCPSQPTASRWLQQREELGSDISPGRRKPKATCGRKRKDVSYQVEVMANGPSTLRKQDYQFHQQQASCSYQTLRRRMKE